MKFPPKNVFVVETWSLEIIEKTENSESLSDTMSCLVEHLAGKSSLVKPKYSVSKSEVKENEGGFGSGFGGL